METINIIIVLQGLLWALLILSSRLKTIEKASLSLIMIMCVFIQIAALIPNERSTFLLSNILSISLGFLILSLFSLYILQSISPKDIKSLLRNHLILLPLFIAVVNPIFFINGFSKHSLIIFAVFLFIILYVLIIGIIKLFRFAKKKQFSSHFLEDTGLMISSLLI